MRRPRIRVVDPVRYLELLDLAEIVNEHAGHQEITIDLRIDLRGPRGQQRHVAHVLGQAADVGMVPHARRRRLQETPLELLISEYALEELPKIAVSDGGHDAEVSLYRSRAPSGATATNCAAS